MLDGGGKPFNELEHTSSIYTPASLSEFRHASGEETSQLRGSIHGGRRGCISTSLIAITSRSVTGYWWSKTPGGFRQARHGWRTPYRRRARPAGHFPENWRRTIIGNGLLQSLSLGDI